MPDNGPMTSACPLKAAIATTPRNAAAVLSYESCAEATARATDRLILKPLICRRMLRFASRRRSQRVFARLYLTDIAHAPDIESPRRPPADSNLRRCLICGRRRGPVHQRSGMVRVLIADADAATRGTLRRILEGDSCWQVCGEASTGPQAVEIALGYRCARSRNTGDERLGSDAPDQEGAAKHRDPDSHDARDRRSDPYSSHCRRSSLSPQSAADQQVSAAVDALSQHRPYLMGTTRQSVLDAYLKTTEADRRLADRPLASARSHGLTRYAVSNGAIFEEA